MQNATAYNNTLKKRKPDLEAVNTSQQGKADEEEKKTTQLDRCIQDVLTKKARSLFYFHCKKNNDLMHNICMEFQKNHPHEKFSYHFVKKHTNILFEFEDKEAWIEKARIALTFS